MSKVKKVEIYNKKIYKEDKDGNAYKDKNGKRFVRVLIQTDYNPDDYASALAYSKKDKELQVKEGKEYELVFDRNGKYLNWSFPSRVDRLEARIEKLERWKENQTTPQERQQKHTDKAEQSDWDAVNEQIEDEADDGIDPDDIPF